MDVGQPETEMSPSPSWPSIASRRQLTVFYQSSLTTTTRLGFRIEVNFVPRSPKWGFRRPKPSSFDWYRNQERLSYEKGISLPCRTGPECIHSQVPRSGR